MKKLTKKEIEEIKVEMLKIPNMEYSCDVSMTIKDYKSTAIHFEVGSTIGTEEILVFAKLIETYDVKICIVDEAYMEDDTKEEINDSCFRYGVDELDDIYIPTRTIISVSYEK